MSSRAGRLIRSGLAAGAVAALAACSGGGSAGSSGSAAAPATNVAAPAAGSPAPAAAGTAVDVYAHTRAGMLSPVVAHDPALVYVPELGDGTVTVIDQATLRTVRVLRVGREPQHVVPSWDLRTLWVNNDRGNSLTPLDPATGRARGAAVAVHDPYNLYFTPDGGSAMVMAEAAGEIDFDDPHTFAPQSRLRLDRRCRGVNHADFSPDGRYAIATCEFSGQLVKIDLAARRVVGYLDLNGDRPAAPQDIKIDPAGRTWYVADMNADGVHEIDGDAFRTTGFLPTGPETHGMYPSRDGRFLYVANRGGMLMSDSEPYPHTGAHGSVSVVDFATRRVVAQWRIPGGGTPDMGGVSADGSRLWLSGRRSDEVYVFDTGGADPTKGHLLRKLPVGHEPHGLAVWPQPGRFSLGHTGILR